MKSREQLLQENEDLSARLAEAEETLRAIRQGEVDAIVVSGPRGEMLYSLVGADSVYRLIVETMKEAALTVTAGGQILFCNAQFGQMIGRPLEEIVAHPLHEFVSPESRSAAGELLAASESRPVKQRLVLLNSDGNPVPAYVSSTVLQQPDGPSVCIVAADLTELENSTAIIQELRDQQQAVRDANDRLQAQAQELRGLMEERGRLLESERFARSEADRANRLKDEFLANLSHELRTPLNSILGWTQILRNGPVNTESLTKGLEVIERSARAQSQLISDLLDVSRIISGKMRLQTLNCDPVEALEAAIDSVRPAAEAKRIRIEKLIEPRPGPVLADLQRLQQAFWNLLSNAVKFTPAGGRVQIAMRRTDSRIEIMFRDTGKGIHPDFLPHIFERFRQADSSASKDHAGLGLGLAIVKNLVELHGGTVKAESPGEAQGTTFTITLPLIAVRQEDDPVSLSRGAENMGLEPSALKGVKVLFVDDEHDTREMVKRLLEGFEVAVSTAGSAAEGVAAVQELRPDVLIGDIGMPREDGYEMIRRIRELPPEAGGQTPAVALTAYSRMEDRTRAMLAGYQYHLAKPVDAAELITALGMVTKRIPKPSRSHD